jgi:hypothetical protein
MAWRALDASTTAFSIDASTTPTTSSSRPTSGNVSVSVFKKIREKIFFQEETRRYTRKDLLSRRDEKISSRLFLKEIYLVSSSS